MNIIKVRKLTSIYIYILIFIFSTVISLWSPKIAYAAVPQQFDLSNLPDFINDIYKLITALGVVLAILVIPYIAVLFASGSPENLKKGKEWLFSLITGLIVILLASVIIKISAQQIFGL